jgi:hypothetical protein
VRNRIVLGRKRLELLRRPELVLEAPVTGIPYYDLLVASNIREGDELVLKPEPENRFDSNAIQVLFAGMQIGYVERESAHIIARELRMGKVAEAYVTAAIPKTEEYKFPRISVTIKLR